MAGDHPHDDPTATLVEGGRHASERRKKPARPPTERPAPQMLGRYVILSELGRGGMSTVYVAYDPELDRRVALKVVRGDQLTALHRARLHREAQALARLSHPSVVTVFDVGDIDDDTFIAMELVDGVSLREWIKQPRTWREVVKVVVAAGRGLAAAHAAGIVHRDVKPDNIVIAANGAVKLVDFGLARDLGDKTLDSQEFAREEPSLPPEQPEVRDSHDDLQLSANSSGNLAARPLEAITQMGFVVGTPAYMPPEQLSKSPEADERSDQFSLCATLYEGLYQKKPFKTSKRIALDHREALTVAERPGNDTRTLAAPPPRNTDVPAWLQRVVTRGLAVDPAARYPSVDALLAAIDRDPARTVRRASAAVAVVLAAAAIATIVTWRLMPAQQQAASCGTGADRVAAVWNTPTRVELERVVASRGAAGASAAFGVFAKRVDQYVTDWQGMYQEACTATRVHAAQSEEALDLRMTCLDHRLGELGALVEVMHDADAEALSKAGEVAESLTPIAECADLQALKQLVRRPTDPASVARLAAIDGDLAHVQALYAVGDITKTLSLVDRVIADARAMGYPPQLARALYWRGRAMADRDGGPEAEAMFDQTFASALSAGEDMMAADAAARIAQEALWAAQLPEFERWSRITRALAERSHAEGVVRFIDQLGCMANHYSGKVRTRLACLRALAARKDGEPNEWLVTTLGIAASEAGEPADAIHWLEQGVAIARADNGADHPRTLEMRAYLCNGLKELGDYTRAADECRDALTRLQKVAPDATKLIARLQLYLAQAELARHHADVARPLLQEAEKAGDDEVKLAAKGDLSELGGVHGDVTAAIAEHREGLAEMIKTFAQYNPHHPNIIAEHHELGAALLAHGDYAAAAAELTTADTEADENEMSPFEIAQIRFARAQALAKLPHHDAALVGRLAQNALDLYVRHAPDTERFRSDREAIEQWLAGLH